MICVPKDFKPLLSDLKSSFARPATARRFLYFFAAVFCHWRPHGFTRTSSAILAVAGKSIYVPLMAYQLESPRVMLSNFLNPPFLGLRKSARILKSFDESVITTSKVHSSKKLVDCHECF